MSEKDDAAPELDHDETVIDLSSAATTDATYSGLASRAETLLASAQSDADAVERVLQTIRQDAATRHRQLHHLARGGMGRVEVVLDSTLRRRIARKVIEPKLQETALAVRLFVREAQVTGQLDHPAIVPVHELGIDASGHLFFTMKLVEGQSLHHFIRSMPAGRLSLGNLFSVLEIVLKVCDGLAFAHNRGVIHCDVKPRNIMVGGFGQVYLMDWGLARIRRADGTYEAADDVQGTPSFMSPEQANNRTVDERSDVFALGGLLYFALARVAPYGASGLTARLEQARKGSYRPLSELDLALAPELERIVGRAMAIDPDERFASVRELRDELTRFLRGGEEFPHQSFGAGEHILREGDEGDAAYILLSGRAEAYRTVDGERVSLGTMVPGEVFGEMAILTGSCRTASVVATEDCELVVITGETVAREMAGMKPWMASLTRSLAERFRDREQRSQES